MTSPVVTSPVGPPQRFVDQVVGAGFVVEEGSLEVSGDEVRLHAVRGRTLADTVGEGMCLLACGINASVYSADAGIGYARPGNRFWPAALGAGIVDKDRDPIDALIGHGVGMTDFVKRATRTAAEVTTDEYRRGLARVERLPPGCPPAVCFNGLSGWRAVVDRHAVAGPQEQRIGGRPVYVMPSTSGLNARTPLRAPERPPGGGGRTGRRQLTTAMRPDRTTGGTDRWRRNITALISVCSYGWKKSWRETRS